jgi:hypothetical protein
MVRNTRKNRKLGRHSRKSGGATKKFPGVTNETTLEEFEREWDVFYISAHGGILDDTIKVPENTYILSTTPTTELCHMHPDLKKLGILYENNNAKDISYKQNFMNFAKKPRLLVPFLYKRSQIATYRPGSNNIPLVTSIYEPKDEIQDMSFAFSSHVVKKENQATKGITHFVVPGIFKLPMSKSVKTTRNELLKNTREKVKAEILVKDLETLLEKANTEYIGLNENLVKDIKKELNIEDNKLLLSQILHSKHTQASPGKKRFFLIHTCKEIIGKHNEEHKKSHRSVSVGRIIKSEVARLKSPESIEEIKRKEEEEAKRKEEEAKRKEEETEARRVREAEKKAAEKAAAAAKKLKQKEMQNSLKELGY